MSPCSAAICSSLFGSPVKRNVMMTDTNSSSLGSGRRIFDSVMASDQEPTGRDVESRSFLGSFFRILARNILFLGGGRGPTPEEVDERDDVLKR